MQLDRIPFGLLGEGDTLGLVVGGDVGGDSGAGGVRPGRGGEAEVGPAGGGAEQGVLRPARGGVGLAEAVVGGLELGDLEELLGEGLRGDEILDDLHPFLVRVGVDAGVDRRGGRGMCAGLG
eukprot:764409-Hanusia_phi.AAC.4